jgi:transposase InsO family protein
MDYHHHARLFIREREELARSVVEGRLTVGAAAAAHGVSRQSASKWVRRYREEGEAGLRDRTCRPRLSPCATSETLVSMVRQLRLERRTGMQIAHATGLSRATVSRLLQKMKLNRIHMLEPKLPAVRYEHAAAGDLLHIDIKKLARIKSPGKRITGNPQDETRGAGWEFLYVAIDDHSRMAYTAILPDEKGDSAAAFLGQAEGYFRAHDITLRRVITDNGPCFRSNRFRDTCRAVGAKPIRTRFYRPQTNGKAERFIQTAIREWAYARSYQNSEERNSHLPAWTHQYNWHRPHSALNQKPPISRSPIDVNKLLTHDI